MQTAPGTKTGWQWDRGLLILSGDESEWQWQIIPEVGGFKLNGKRE